jgi:hypothetical protein
MGLIAGTAAGRERFEQIRSGTAAVASDLGPTRVSQHLRLRSGDVARNPVDVDAETTCDGFDTAADRLEALLQPPTLMFTTAWAQAQTRRRQSWRMHMGLITPGTRATSAADITAV